MIRFTIRTILKNKILWAWPGIFVLFAAATFYWGGISPSAEGASFVFNFGKASLPSGMVMSQITSFVVLMGIIGFPNHFAKALEPERASLMLSNPISRSEFFFSDLAAMVTISLAYAFLSVFPMAILLGIEGGIFPMQFFLTMLLFLPLLLLTYYVTIVLFLILTDSYLAGALLGWIVTGFSSLFLNIEKVLTTFGINSETIHTTMDVLSFLIPSSAAIQQVMQAAYGGGFTAIDGSLLAFALATFLPMTALSYYLYLNKEF